MNSYSFNSINNNPFFNQHQSTSNNEQNHDFFINNYLLEENHNYQELPVDNQNSNLLNSYMENSFNTFNNSNSDNDINIFNDYYPVKINDKNYYDNEDISDDNLIKVDNPDSLKEEENNKFLLYLIKNNFISENYILEKDISINKEKNSFDKKINNIINKLKCKGCLKMPNDFFICSFCKSIFCENCLGKEV